MPSSSSFLETMRPFKWTASIIPSSMTNSERALSTSEEENLSPKVMSECLNISALIFPLTSKASKALRMVSSSSAPPAIFSAERMTICVKLTGPGASESMPWASPSEMDLPTEEKAATMSEEDKRPSLSASMIPKASLNSWICLWLKRAKTLEPLFLAFFDPEPLAILCLLVCGLEEGGNQSESLVRQGPQTNKHKMAKGSGPWSLPDKRLILCLLVCGLEEG